jgi:hypothetical protein
MRPFEQPDDRNAGRLGMKGRSFKYEGSGIPLVKRASLVLSGDGELRDALHGERRDDASDDQENVLGQRVVPGLGIGLERL